MAPRLLVVSLVLGWMLAGCFEVRALDRRFDAGVDAAAGGDAGPEAGARCDSIDKSCDGIDDDCDGRYDEDFAEAEVCGIGQCRVGSTPARCVSGFPIDCLPGPAEEETCNGLDDDCDGLIDENLVQNCGRRGGECRRGESRCVEGEWTVCDGIEPTAETCDGRDEDCDGQTDEGLTRACEGAGRCGEGVEACMDGAWQGCDAGGEAAPEQCNGIDDDCDGRVDEEQPDRPCGNAVGACREGTQACIDGAWGACVGAVEPAPVDTCDGADDDCDGEVDEGDGPCGACELDSRPICPLGVDPCPEVPPFTLCIRELHRVNGEADRTIGRHLVAGGDLDGDGVDDFVTAGRRRVRGISGRRGAELWNRNAPADDIVSLAAADLTGSGRRETLVVDGAVPRGEVIIFDPDGARRDSADGQLATPLHGGLAVLDGEQRFGVGAPTAEDGEGRMRLLRYAGEQIEGNWTDVALPAGDRFGAVLAAGRRADGLPVVAATVGSGDEQRVWGILDGLDESNQPAVELIPPARGVGAQLLIGQLAEDQPAALAARNALQPWVDLATLVDEGEPPRGVRLPLDDVAEHMALIPGRDGAPPLLMLLVGETIRILRIGDEGAAALIDFPLPDDVRALLGEQPAAIAGAAHGPDGSRLLGIGVPGGPDDAGQVVIFRLD